ncbi:MAG: hypothetical protein L3J03_11460 [Desulfobacterales bacterium]|nr:hypothetical protein [Desulfobacterales bacterium]
MRIAIVTTNGKTVNEHFGKADVFHIYTLDEQGPAPREERRVTPLSVGDKSHSFDQDCFSAVAAALEGCARVYCTRIGDRPAEELKKLGITPVIYEGPIDKIRV